MIRRTPVGILLADLDTVFLDYVSSLMFETSLVQVTDVISVANGHVPTSGSMAVGLRRRRHSSAPFVLPR
jgi:hypothetical protein